MRDVFFDEIETDDPEAYIRQKFPDKNLKYEKTVEADGSLVFDIEDLRHPPAVYVYRNLNRAENTRKAEKKTMSEEKHTHVHVLEDGTVIEHSHDHAHGHHHTNTKAVLNRLSRAIGHMESIKRMVEEGRDCTEVLIQLSAVKAAINNTGKIILEDHIEHCIVDAVEHGDIKAIQELNKAIDRFVK